MDQSATEFREIMEMQSRRIEELQGMTEKANKKIHEDAVINIMRNT